MSPTLRFDGTDANWEKLARAMDKADPNLPIQLAPDLVGALAREILRFRRMYRHELAEQLVADENDDG